ncbi:MAG: type II toxin-antitoxin system YhaV family toxin [Ginsengibacter sp.]
MNRSTGRAGAPPQSPALVINGWRFLAWPDFHARWTRLVAKASAQRGLQPTGVLSSPEATMLAALIHVMRDVIAREPNETRAKLKRDLSAWRRVKLLGRFRLFYRFSSQHKLIILTWLNDQSTLRKEGSSTDPYEVFAGMLSRGEIPKTWEALVAGSLTMTAPLPSLESETPQAEG